MEFSYYNERNELKKVNIQLGTRWYDLHITNSKLHSIFINNIDNGDSIISSYEELSKLEKLLQTADGILNLEGKNNILENEELDEVIKQIDEGEITLSDSDNTKTPLEKVTHHQRYATIENDETDVDTVCQQYIDKIKEDLKKYNNYDERFPDSKYEVNVVYNGKYYESFVYNKEYASLKKSDPQKLQQSINDFIDGNFEVIYEIENPVEFMEAYRKKSGGKTMFSALITNYKDGKLSSDKLNDYMSILEKKFENFEREYKKANPDNNFDNSFSSWYGNYFDLSVRVRNHIKKEEGLPLKYEEGKIDKNQVLELQRFVNENYNIELNEYIAIRIIEQNTFDYGIFEYDIENIKKRFMNISKGEVEYYTQYPENEPYTKNDVDKNDIKELQKLFKDLYGKEISENTAAFEIKMSRIGKQKGFNLEKFKADCLNENLFANSNTKDFKEYLDTKILCRDLGVENDSIETLEKAAQSTEIEYSRYSFDIHKSEVADLACHSEKMIKQAEKELLVTKTDTQIIIKNKSTGENRVIDLNQMTSKLDDKHKQMLLDAINGFNKLSLWEFAIEAANGIGTSVHNEERALAEYNIENDSININPKTDQKIDSNTLLHEMVHAMMATIIDGKNTTNEYLFKEFVDTFNEEQKAHEEKRLRHGAADGSNYTYCAQNIMEFAAESGCLWLSGKSNSEFTIATHFPKSYRLFIQLIERIRAQKTGRSINK